MGKAGNTVEKDLEYLRRPGVCSTKKATLLEEGLNTDGGQRRVVEASEAHMGARVYNRRNKEVCSSTRGRRGEVLYIILQKLRGSGTPRRNYNTYTGSRIRSIRGVDMDLELMWVMKCLRHIWLSLAWCMDLQHVRGWG